MIHPDDLIERLAAVHLGLLLRKLSRWPRGGAGVTIERQAVLEAAELCDRQIRFWSSSANFSAADRLLPELQKLRDNLRELPEAHRCY